MDGYLERKVKDLIEYTKSLEKRIIDVEKKVKDLEEMACCIDAEFIGKENDNDK